MSDEVGVEPERVNAAASALEGLRDALAANVPTIVNTMNMYWNDGNGSPINLSALHQAQAQSVPDAASMRSRYNAALAWLNDHSYIPDITTAYVPWDGPQLDAVDAKYEAELLAEAQDPAMDPAWARQQIQSIQTDIQDHVAAGDTQWLKGFYLQAGPNVAKLATTLSQEDGKGLTPLSDSDKKILATYANGLATLTRDGNLSDAETKQLTAEFTTAAGSDPWSAAMLLKSLPGSAYGSTANGPGANLLAGVSEKVLDAYQNGKLDLPLNLNDYGPGKEPSNNDIKAAVTANDPLSAMLALDAQNKTASQEVLAGFDPVTGQVNQGNGQQWAKLLLTQTVEHNLYTPVSKTGAPGAASFFRIMPGYGPPTGFGKGYGGGPEWNNYTIDPKLIGSFLDASTAGPRDGGQLSNAEFSAYSAANIILSTPPSEGDNGVHLPQPVRQALANTFGRYMLDLGMSAGDQSNLPQITDQVFLKNGQRATGDWHFNIPSDLLPSYLQQVSADPQTYGNLKAELASKMGYALGLKLNGITDGTNDDAYSDLATLYGRLIKEQTTNQYLKGKDTDIRNAMLNALLDEAESNVNLIPVVGPGASKVISYDQKLKAFGVPQIPEFSTDNASNAAQEGLRNFTEAQLTVMVPIVQGLVQNGQIKPDPSWYQDGKIIPNPDFYNWYEYQKNAAITDYTAPVIDRSGNIVGYSSVHLDDLMLNASGWMGLGGSGFRTDFGSGGGG
jgi:hypothetical protein